MSSDDYWFGRYQETHTANWAVREAACLAVGAAGYLLSDDCRATPTQRLTHLREVVTDLRTALGLPTETTPTTNSSTDATNPTEGETR
jgi:hypothetical protein